MLKIHPLYFLSLIALLFSCTETEKPKTDFGMDYQPLEVGLFWEYEVNETIVFGETDEESSTYFLKDRIIYTYFNVENEMVYVLAREKSTNGINWEIVGNYLMQYRNMTLLRTFENKKTVNLVFPPELDKTWDAQIFNSGNPDEYEISFLGKTDIGSQSFSKSLKVLQEEEDDQITFRDNRYEVFAKGIGLVEQYYEVFTYCSRNDCLGKMIVDSGRLTHLKIKEYGKL
ncbi:hypothetical protein M3O96_14315 [Aquiflexum sp. TKW24L]|uniref:hypothetical protein n=1 Tax=Aquiflexum sp. TKW24L TaxID=2942212 RepID=UPI0020C03318|nr:hypothetical protein [Aquiflexum sp. TKW24L]MCL6260272.1 hypothetical protein [Aquiflexum sp. TKW24L]